MKLNFKKIKILFAILTIVFNINFTKANPGDTITVVSHNKTLWSWWGNKDLKTLFPSDTISFNKILMKYTLGCPSSGCSPWDYTTKIEILRNTGKWDSTLTKYPKFTINGQAKDSIKLSFDTLYTTYFNTDKHCTDSTTKLSSKIRLFNNKNLPQTATDSLYAWEAGYYNKYYNASGIVIDSIYISGDTLWKLDYHNKYTPYLVKEPIELARVMTPYAGNYANTWTNTWVFDVTDYAPLLHDSVEIRAFYGGWSSGFTITITFEMIKGTPPRKAIDVKNIYCSGPNGFEYGITTNPIENKLKPIKIKLKPQETNSILRFVATGHSFGDVENCAEFCVKNYYVKINGVQRFSKPIWRNDCGLNYLFPQAGTWLYDRSNWCPGAEAKRHDFDLSKILINNDSNTIDIDLDPYTYTGGASFNPQYIIDVQLITYSNPNFHNEASLENIIEPNNERMHSRYNPMCGRPRILIKNNGIDTLKSLQINYGVKGINSYNYQWSGTLAFNDTTQVILPSMDYFFTESSSNQFFVNISNPNNANDEVLYNNSLTSKFNNVLVHPEQFIVYFRTNNNSTENSYEIRNINDSIVFSKNELLPNTIYRDTIKLPNGCYEFVMHDTVKDGISFWANPEQGNGLLKFVKITGQTFRSFNGDFGTQLRYSFRTSSNVDIPIITNNNKIINIYPNPSHGAFCVDLSEREHIQNMEIKVYNFLGETIFSRKIKRSNIFDIEIEQKGMYIIQILENEKIIQTEKININ